jgi:hypothetical protein
VAVPKHLPSWPGLARPSTPRRLKDEADIAANISKGKQTKAL